jgi:cellulose synthase/poly-beta-1,6-N-acetylglucosamine synthase-like glycosyltransferase
MAGAFKREITMTAIALVVWGAALLVVYVYAGYPILLWIVTRFVRRRIHCEEITPAVTLLISAYNEARVIRSKLDNALSLGYPSEGLEIIVVSDASTDETDAIVKSLAGRGVKLLRTPERRGKTVGLNAAMREACGEIIVFSDANILYKRDAIRQIVRNFADPNVGCVTGNSCYAENFESAAHLQENNYWQYEQTIRSLESQLGSTVGGDGAIFAIRRELYTPLEPDAINDLVIPLQIVVRGYRAVFEPAAVGIERTTGNFSGEFRRKRRIVNRSWHGLMSMPEVLNPRRLGWFAWQVWSHKVLRWLVLPVLVLAGAGCLIAAPLGLQYRIGAWGFTASLIVAGIGAFVPARFGKAAWLMHAAWYFYLVNFAAVTGIAMALAGRVEMLWTPERGRDAEAH